MHTLQIVFLLAAQTPPASPSAVKDWFDGSVIAELIIGAFTLAALIGGLKVQSSTNTKQIADLKAESAKQNAELKAESAKQNSDLKTSITEALKKHVDEDGQDFDARDVRLNKLEKQNTEQEVTLSANRELHNALNAKHDVLAGEARNRMSAYEQRLSAVEQGTVETRTEMRALTQTVGRIDANVEVIRQDIVAALLSGARKRTTKR